MKGSEGVEVIDDYTVMIRLNSHADYMDPWRTLGIMPEHLLSDVAPKAIKQHPFGTQCPVGNGPSCSNRTVHRSRWVFGPNPAFPEALGGRPFLDRYIYRIMPEQTTILTELRGQGRGRRLLSH